MSREEFIEKFEERHAVAIIQGALGGWKASTEWTIPVIY